MYIIYVKYIIYNVKSKLAKTRCRNIFENVSKDKLDTHL